MSRRLIGGLLSGGLLAALPGLAAADALLDQGTASSLLRVFTDSDHVTVRSLIGDYATPLQGWGALTVHVNNERVEIPGITAPVGSQAAIDAITTASRPIAANAWADFVKVRNEVESEVKHGSGAMSYYVSSESDYLAQQVGATWSHDDQDRQLNLSLGTSYGWDAIRPLPDGTVQAPPASKTTLHWNAVATQVLSPTTLLRYGLEYNVVNGLQHNPYRNVFAGGTYVPERVPDHRERRDAFLRLHQYVADHSSLKLDYRLYSDDWGITSHEIASSIDQYLTRHVSASYQYRWYTQSRADFYRAEYDSPAGVGGYLTGDYRLDDLASHLFGASLHWDLASLAADHPLLGRAALWLSIERYFNSNDYSANILETGLDLHFQ